MSHRLSHPIAGVLPPLLLAVLPLLSLNAHAQQTRASAAASIQASAVTAKGLQTVGDLASALAQASARDPQLRELGARLEQAQAGIDLAHSLTPGPAAASLNHLSDRLQRDQGRREWEVELATPLWLPGQRAASARLAEGTLAELQTRQALRQLALAGELRDSWWQIALARATHTLALERVQTAQALAQTVRRRYQSGDVARVDANLAHTEQLSAQAEALEAATALMQAQQAYSALTGAPPPDELAPEMSTATSPESALAPRPNGHTEHPQWRALQSAVALAHSRLALVDNSRRDAPELALRWTTQRADALSPAEQAVGIKLTVPLSSSDRVRQDSAGARADLAQAEQALALLQAQLELAEQRARSELATAEAQRELATARRELTADNLKLAQRAFDLGEQDLATLLRASSADHEARAWLTRQRIACQAAVSRLQQALGLLPQLPQLPQPPQPNPSSSQP